VAARLGHSVKAVRIMRERLDIPNPEDAYWTVEEAALLATMNDEEVAEMTGRTIKAVACKRRKLLRQRGR
jgi:hypothetical protein